MNGKGEKDIPNNNIIEYRISGVSYKSEENLIDEILSELFACIEDLLKSENVDLLTEHSSLLKVRRRS